MLVSIIIPYFNDPNNIKFCIQSALAQNYPKLEILIIDDENSINSKKILKEISKFNKKIKIFNTKKNKGVSFARNLGIKKSNGKFIAFLDSDDLWKKNKIKNQIFEIKKRKLDVCYSDFKTINDNKNFSYKVKLPKKLNYDDLLKACPICCSSIIVKSQIIKKNKFSKLKTKEDYELWLRLSKNKFKFGGVNKYLTFYKIRKNSLSSHQVNKLINAFKIYKDYNNYGIVLSLLFTIRLYYNAFIKKFL